MPKLPKTYVVGPNTLGGYHSMGATGELAVPDYMHPALGPGKLRVGSPAKLTLWFESFEEAMAFAAFLRQQELERLTDGITEKNRHPES